MPVTVAEAATEVINEPMQEAPVVQETVAEATAAEVMESAAPVMEDAEGEEIEEETADTDTAAPTYSSDMPVDEICSMMTYEEAGNVIVPLGTCKGWAMSQVADRRPASLNGTSTAIPAMITFFVRQLRSCRRLWMKCREQADIHRYFFRKEACS